MGQQLELIGRQERNPQPVSDDIIHRQPTLLAALRLSMQVGGVEEKEVYMALGIDKATWSKIMSGQFNFPTNRYNDFMRVVGNEIPLVWLAGSRGYKLQPMQTEHERQIAELTAENLALKSEMQIVRKWFAGVKS